jgi:hypothetical protein
MGVGERFALNHPRFEYRRWPDGGVVHDVSDAAVYQVTAVAAEALDVLSNAGPLPASELALRLLGESPDESDLALIGGMLQHLCELGVVRREPR